jgi:hypothetical protein
MKKILESMSLDDVQTFWNSKARKYIEDFLTEMKANLIASTVETYNPDMRLALTSEFSAVMDILKLISAFDEILHPKPVKAEAPHPLQGWASQKPDELIKPIKLGE